MANAGQVYGLWARTCPMWSAYDCAALMKAGRRRSGSHCYLGLLDRTGPEMLGWAQLLCGYDTDLADAHLRDR
jgi:hypothetical protein